MRRITVQMKLIVGSFVLVIALAVMLAVLGGTESEVKAQGPVPNSLPLCPRDPGPYIPPEKPPEPLKAGTGFKGVACRAVPTGVRRVPPGWGPVVADKSYEHNSPGYHHMGAVTSQDTLSIWGQIYVSNPATRAGTDDTVAARFLVKTDDNVKAMEVGWIEGGNGDQCVYTLDWINGGLEFCQYDLEIGQGYYFQLRYDGGNPAIWSSYLFWNGQWIALDSEYIGFTYAEQTEEFVEIWTADGVHFNVPRTDVGTPVQIQVGGTFYDWTTQFPTTEYNWNNPYETHWLAKYNDWYVHTH